MSDNETSEKVVTKSTTDKDKHEPNFCGSVVYVELSELVPFVRKISGKGEGEQLIEVRNPFNVPEDTHDEDMQELRRGIEPLKLPVVEVKCDDDQAIEILSTSNMHRSKVSLIEKIRSCGFVYCALRRKGRYSGQSEKAADVVGNMFHLKPKQVQRYSTLLNLNEKLLMIVFREKPDLHLMSCRV